MPPDDSSSPSPWIALPPEGDGGRANIVRIHDAHPAMGLRFYGLFMELMERPGPLRRSQRELIASVVSSENGCHY